jgi:hypothetical protein
MSRKYEAAGCMHIHYQLRWKERGFPFLGDEAKKGGADFLIITPHTPDRKIRGGRSFFSSEGYYGGTLIITGEEAHDTKKNNHLLVLGNDKWYGGRDTKEIFSSVKKNRDLSFVAHPLGTHRLFVKKKNHRWKNWNMKEFTGLEICSLLFNWVSGTTPVNLPLRYFFFPENVPGPYPGVVKKWDGIARSRKVVGVAGLDMHFLPFFIKCLDIRRAFAFHKIFGALKNHVLLDRPLSGKFYPDKKAIMESFEKGHLFFAFDYIKDSTGFFFGDENGDFIMGDKIQSGRKAVIKNPEKAEIRCLKNGEIIMQQETEFHKIKLEDPGIYRIEVYREGRPWIFSNHIYVE